MSTSRLAAAPPRSRCGRINWPVLGKIFSIGLLVFVSVVLVVFARKVDWHEVLKALHTFTPTQIALAGLLTAGSFVLYGCYDLFGRHYTGHALSAPHVMRIAAISYAFNLTLGSIIGAAGMRLRLYQQAGVKVEQVAKIIGISVAMNWLGYALAGGVLFATGLIRLPASWGVLATSLPAIGWTLLLVLAAYLATTFFYGDCSCTVRGRPFTLPRTPATVLQTLVACGNWLLMGGILFLLMQQRIAYPWTLATILVASIAGIISRVPGGLGVLEAVALTLLSGQLPQSQVLAGVLAYRAIYYFAPLLIAALVVAALLLPGRERPAEK